MTYDEWIKNIEILKKVNDNDIKNKLLKEENTNLKEMLEPKIIELIKYKFVYSTDKIIKNLLEIFSDNYILDMYLVNLKKELKFINELTFIKVINIDNQKYIRNYLKNETKNIYDILIREANAIDNIGIFETTIKHNMYEWEE